MSQTTQKAPSGTKNPTMLLETIVASWFVGTGLLFAAVLIV